MLACIRLIGRVLALLNSARHLFNVGLAQGVLRGLPNRLQLGFRFHHRPALARLPE